MTGRRATLARMQLRELSRRRGVLALLVGLPLAWYGSATAGGLDYAIGSGMLGVGWCIGTIALFTVLGARAIDLRLVCAGLHPWEVISGRLVPLLGTALALAAFFTAVMTLGSRPDRPATVALAITLTAVVAVGTGLLVAAVVPRELEGTLLLIAIVGIQVGIPGRIDLFMPLYAPLRLTDPDQPTAPALPLTLHAAGYALMLTGVAMLLWYRRIRLAPAGGQPATDSSAKLP
jgi:hypothetical protein